MKHIKGLIAMAILGCCSLPVLAHNDTLFIPDAKVLETHYLKPGLRQYLVYNVLPGSPQKQFMWFWQRNIAVKTINHQKRFVITQKWTSVDSAYFKTFKSINRAVDFSPIFQLQKSNKGVSAFNWGPKRILGADSIMNNQKKGFVLDFKKPNLNWNLDMETFEMLPLEKNRIFAINFYDAGIDQPQYLTYKVIGEDSLPLYGNQAKIICWVLFMEGEYKGNKFTETFWISKKDHVMLKEKDDLGHGAFRYKIRLPDLALPATTEILL